LKPNQAKHLLELHDSGSYTQAELAELFGVGRSTIYEALHDSAIPHGSLATHESSSR
jgi:DNA-binding XRE family transcriptional regulator